MYEVLRVHKPKYKTRFANANRAFIIGGWSTGMIGVSKTFGRGSIPLPPANFKSLVNSTFARLFLCFIVSNFYFGPEIYSFDFFYALFSQYT